MAVALWHEQKRIVDEVGSWKVIRVKDLYRVINPSIGYKGFCKIVQWLEREGFLESKNFRRQGKYLTLTKKGAKHYEHGNLPNPEHFEHDLVATATLLKLTEFENFSSACAGEEAAMSVNLDLHPDGIIHAEKNGCHHTLAVEIELNQKAGERVADKFERYSEDSSLGNVIYITNKRGLYKTYIRILSGMDDEVRKTVVLSFSELLGTTGYDYRKATYWFDGKDGDFESLFGW